MMWMPYICVVAFVIAAAAPRYRRTALVMCGAFSIDILVAPYSGAPHPYFIVALAGYYDAVTAFIVLKYGWKGAVLQAYVLLAALSVNILLLVDLLTGWDLIYSVYMEAILIVNITAILMMGGAYGDIIRALGRNRVGRRRLLVVTVPNVSVVEHRQADKGSS